MSKNKMPRFGLKHAQFWLEKGLVIGKDAEWVETQILGQKNAKSKKNKYGNKKVVYDNIGFDSKKECERYKILKMLERSGAITNLILQKKYKVIEKTENNRGSYYIADFVYLDVHTRIEIVEDVKSYITRKNPTYILKKKLMKEKFNIDIKEI